MKSLDPDGDCRVDRHGQKNLLWLGLISFGSDLEAHQVLKVGIFQIKISALRRHKITKIRPLLSSKLFKLLL